MSDQTNDTHTPEAEAELEAADQTPAGSEAEAKPVGEAKARISAGYRIRIGVLALGLLGFGAWAAYDGFVGYPQHNEVVNSYVARLNEVREQYPETWKEKWPDIAVKEDKLADFSSFAEVEYGKEGEPPKIVGKRKTQSDIYFQYGMLGLAAPVGLFFLLGWFAAPSRWIAMDENGLTSSRGDNAPFDKIHKLNKERWWKKGIAVVYYKADSGEERTLTLDDWKFEREPTEQMLEAVESRLEPDQIVGQREPLAKLVDPDAEDDEDADGGESEDASTTVDSSDDASVEKKD